MAGPKKPKGAYTKDSGSFNRWADKWARVNLPATERNYGTAAANQAMYNYQMAMRRKNATGAQVITVTPNSGPPVKSATDMAGNASGYSSGYRNSYSRNYGGYGGYGGGGSSAPLTVTSTDSRTTVGSPEEARARVFAVMQELLGRNASASESAILQAALTAYEQANPTVTTTTSTKGMDGASESSVTSVKEGATDTGRQQLIKETAQKTFDKERFAYQAATTYMSALMMAVENPFAEG